MISCADVRAELVALERGESPPGRAEDVLYHIGRCVACAAERESLYRTVALVREHVNPELSADARLQLEASLEKAFARSRQRGLRGLFAPVVGVALAAAAGVLVALWTAPERVTVKAAEIASANPAPPPSPAVSTLARETRDAATRGLAWLSANQHPDGTWTNAASADRETAAVVTASALLAFAANGESPRRGPRALDLRRAEGRLAALLREGFSPDPERKPLYAQALAVRALSATYSLDREAMTPAERRVRRELLADAGRQLVESQNGDGGFGHAAHAGRSDASCTRFAAAALTDLRAAKILEPAGALMRAERFLRLLRSDWAASLPSMAEALTCPGRALGTPVSVLITSQRDDGAFPATVGDCFVAGGDTLTTAFGVLALAQIPAR